MDKDLSKVLCNEDMCRFAYKVCGGSLTTDRYGSAHCETCDVYVEVRGTTPQSIHDKIIVEWRRVKREK